MNRAYKYRVYPTKEQKEFFAKCFGCCRKIWNLMLADKIAYYAETGKMLQTTPAQYKKVYPYLREVDSLALANVQLHLQKAYQGFFKGETGFPKYKSRKKCRRSYTTNCQKNSIRFEKGGILIPKAGTVPAVLHRIPDWKIKSATISQDSDDRYYISVLFEYEEEPVKPVMIGEDTVLGLDYKSDGLYVDSNGEMCGMPKYYRDAQTRLGKLQRKLRHKEPGSRNYQKQQKKIAKLHSHVSAQRRDYLHKKSAAITKQYGYVCVEDLDMKAIGSKGFGKATLDNGYGMFLQMLEYKLKERGGKLVRIDRWFPSTQTCGNCGYKNPDTKELRIRSWVCPVCGAEHDRDINAAKNIKKEGIRLLLAV